MIRYISAEDHPQVIACIAQFRVDLKRLKGIAAEPDLMRAKQELEEYLMTNNPILVAEKEHIILGYLVTKIIDQVMWVESLYVLPKARRSKIASLLHEKAQQLAVELGNDTLYYYVHPNNDAMIAFLASHGYDVLNLIEIRKPWPDEKCSETISVGTHHYRY